MKLADAVINQKDTRENFPKINEQIKSLSQETNVKDNSADKSTPTGENSANPWACKYGSRINPDEKILLEIKEHPFVRNPLVSVTALVAITMFSIVAYYVLPDPIVPAIVFLYFIITNTSFFMPSHYVFTEEKVVVNRIIYRNSFPWSRFRGYAVDKNGIYLSPSRNTAKFDRFRGVFLVMNPENRKLLTPLLKEKIDGSDLPGTC